MASLSMKRSLKARQIGLVNTYHKLAHATETDSGLDKYYTESVEKVSTGVLKITVKEKSCHDVVVAGLVSLTPGAIPSVIAVTKDSVTIECLDTSDAPMDADLALTLVHSKTTNYLY